MHRVSKLKLAEVTPYLVCKLCNGYFIDPCTAQDCLHTFCKTCIVKHLYQKSSCPICDMVIHKTRPLEMIRHDQTIQDLVYKLVPGVFGKEMERRREFYSDHPEPDPNAQGNSEERGEVKDDREILAEDDTISMALVHSPNGEAKPAKTDAEGNAGPATIYLRCPATFTVSGMKKLLRAKFDLSQDYLIDVFHSDESLSDDYTLMDIAYIYTWRRRGPLRVFYTVYQFDEVAAEQKRLAPRTPEPQGENVQNGSVFELADNVTITELIKTSEGNKTDNDTKLNYEQRSEIGETKSETNMQTSTSDENVDTGNTESTQPAQSSTATDNIIPVSTDNQSTPTDNQPANNDR